MNHLVISWHLANLCSLLCALSAHQHSPSHLNGLKIPLPSSSSVNSQFWLRHQPGSRGKENVCLFISSDKTNFSKNGSLGDRSSQPAILKQTAGRSVCSESGAGRMTEGWFKSNVLWICFFVCVLIKLWYLWPSSKSGQLAQAATWGWRLQFLKWPLEVDSKTSKLQIPSRHEHV